MYLHGRASQTVGVIDTYRISPLLLRKSPTPIVFVRGADGVRLSRTPSAPLTKKVQQRSRCVQEYCPMVSKIAFM